MFLRVRCVAIATALAIAGIFVQGEWARAGTTGALSGLVRSQDGAAIVGANVSVASPSESASASTDNSGHFSFVSLEPDTYSVFVSKQGYGTSAIVFVEVLADNTRYLQILVRPPKGLLGHVPTAVASALVRPGTTSDVYSLKATAQAQVASFGGGGSLNAAYAAIATTPGAVVPAGQIGWFQTAHIRGGDFDQLGYEFDGVPVSRSYDNYPTTALSSLGQQELQVYMGSAPADSASQGLAGYISQVVRNGAYPGFGELELGVGSPALFNKTSMEIGGSTPDRNFIYFIGVGGYHQSFRWFDEDNGAGITGTWGTPAYRLQCPNNSSDLNFASCYATGIGPGGYALASPVNSVNVSDVWDYENIINLRFGLPHRNDGGRDDIQLLYDSSYLHDNFYSSASDWGVTTPGLLQNLNGAPVFGYLSGPGLGYQYLGPVGVTLPPTLTAAQLMMRVNPVYFAYNPNSAKPSPYFGGALAAIPSNQRDGTANPNSIIKLQYQKNIGTSSYFRIYGYTNYSLWPQTCPNSGWTNFIAYCPLNAFVQTVDNGVSASFTSQVNDAHLLSLGVDDRFGRDYQSNDSTMLNEAFGLNHNTGADSFLYAVSSNAPLSGVCYSQSSIAVSCYSSNAMTVGLAAAASGNANLSLPASCGTGSCEWFTAENGRLGTANRIEPTSISGSIMDQWNAGEHLILDYGLRIDDYRYKLADTGKAASDFWFNSWNRSFCVLPGSGELPFFNAADDFAVDQACPLINGVQSIRAAMTDVANDTTRFSEFEPRFGGTYTIDAGNVLRFSYGKYSQAPGAGYQQAGVLQQDLASYDAVRYWPAGFRTTTHAIRPPLSDNYDFSWEHQSGDTGFTVTPFLRRTKDQIQTFVLNPRTNFATGLNVGEQSSDGVEFKLVKGDLNRNGLSGMFSLTYTHSLIKYDTIGDGESVLGTVNLAIQLYNSFTSACVGAAPSPNAASRCGVFGAANAVATEPSGVANPYFNAPARPLFDINGAYAPYTVFPGSVEAPADSYETPLNASVVLSYKIDKFAISPQFQYFEGSSYGEPLTGFGVDPSSCSSLAGSVSGDPRYKFGGVGEPFDALSCFGRIPTPDPFTGNFDDLGAFKAPNQLLMHMQLSYAVSPRATLTLNLANIVNTCSGGSSEPWTRAASHSVCSYVSPGYGAPLPFGSNIYNPGATFQPMVQFPYQENPRIQPFNAYMGVKLKL